MSRESKQVEAGTLPTVAPEAGARLRSRAGFGHRLCDSRLRMPG